MTDQHLHLSELDVAFAEDTSERDACYALRYRVYVQEQRRQPPLADHERQLDQNADDATGLLLRVRRAGAVVGTLRIHHGIDTGIPSFVREACKLPDTAGGLRRVAAISRLAIDASHRGGKVTLALLQYAFAWLTAPERGTEQVYILALDEPKLVGLYKLMGFRPLAPERRYATDLGATVPMVLTFDTGKGRG